MHWFCFYQKRCNLVAIKKNDTDGAAMLVNDGYQKLFDEVEASNREQALTRFRDIKREDNSRLEVYTYSTLFGVLVICILAKLVH